MPLSRKRYSIEAREFGVTCVIVLIIRRVGLSSARGQSRVSSIVIERVSLMLSTSGVVYRARNRVVAPIVITPFLEGVVTKCNGITTSRQLRVRNRVPRGVRVRVRSRVGSRVRL